MENVGLEHWKNRRGGYQVPYPVLQRSNKPFALGRQKALLRPGHDLLGDQAAQRESKDALHLTIANKELGRQTKSELRDPVVAEGQPYLSRMRHAQTIAKA